MTESLSNNLDTIQLAFAEIAAKSGIPLEKLVNCWNADTEEFDWNLNYKNSLQGEVNTNIKNLLECFCLARKSIKDNDLVTTKGALIHAAVFARILEGTFRNIHDECYKILHQDPRFTWPEIPDDYEIPEHYNYAGPR